MLMQAHESGREGGVRVPRTGKGMKQRGDIIICHANTNYLQMHKLVLRQQKDGHLPASIVLPEVCRNLKAPLWGEVGVQEHDGARRRMLDHCIACIVRLALLAPAAGLTTTSHNGHAPLPFDKGLGSSPQSPP